MYSLSVSLRGQLPLHGDELLVRVALVRHEEQPRVQPAQPVGPVDEVVARAAAAGRRC